MAKDFIDEDLIRSRPAPGTEPHPARTASDESPRPAAAASGSFFNRRKEQIPEQVSQTSDEIERLRQRQEELERRKQALIEQRRRVEAYEQGRKEVLEKLGRSNVMLEREGEQASRMAAMCTETRTLFQGLQKELAAINPESWGESDFDPELTRALAQIESAALAYRKALDRVNASAWHRGNQEGASAADLAGGGSTGAEAPRAFHHWMLAGFAFSLPLVLIAIVLFVVYMLASGSGAG